MTDYPRLQRLNVFGHARVVFAAQDDPELVARLTRPDCDAETGRLLRLRRSTPRRGRWAPNR
ncbi:MAG TPA: hypothetical protein VFC16_02680 [Nakamurella sp.]|nr:hypothetical protein [Nakamurella sp.]